MQSSEPNPFSPPAVSSSASTSPTRFAPRRRKSSVRNVLALACGSWLVLCALWFCAAIYELIGFTLLQDAYGQHSSVFRASYAKSAIIALVLGLPAAVVFYRIRRPQSGYEAGNASGNDDDEYTQAPGLERHSPRRGTSPLAMILNVPSNTGGKRVHRRVALI